MEKLVLMVALSLGTFISYFQSETKDEKTAIELLSLSDAKFDTTNKELTFELKF